MNLSHLAKAVAAVAVLGSAQAGAVVLTPSAPLCTAGTSSPGYVDCAGSFEGNLAGSLSQDQIDTINAQFGDNGFTYSTSMVYSKSDSAGSGVFTDLGDDFSLAFDGGASATGLFVIGLKQADRYSLFLFDGGATGISAIDISNTIAGVASQTGGLSHAVYIGGETLVPGIPEPQTYALMLAGLAAVGFMARRRRAN
jgi:hypothetical protein